MSAAACAFAATLREVMTTRALLSTMVVAVLFYAFYYPAPYRHQGVVDLPVVVVDEEDSAVTRALVRALDQSPAVAVVGMARSARAGEQAVRERRAEAVLLLSDGLGRRLLSGAGTGGISLTLNGTYLLRARGVALAVESALAGIVADRLPAGAAAALPLRIEARPLFNPTTGYADYIFPVVSVVILQQTLLFGAAMLAARRKARGEPTTRGAALAGTLAALTLIGAMACFFYFGLVFWIEDMPRGGNVSALLVAVPLFSLAVAALGLLIGSFLDEGDRAMEILVPTSVVLFFLTGAAWPTQMMPAWVRAIADLSPATPGVPLFVGLNQMGASLSELSGPLLHLAILGVVYASLALLCAPARAPGVSAAT